MKRRKRRAPAKPQTAEALVVVSRCAAEPGVGRRMHIPYELDMDPIGKVGSKHDLSGATRNLFANPRFLAPKPQATMRPA